MRSIVVFWIFTGTLLVGCGPNSEPLSNSNADSSTARTAQVRVTVSQPTTAESTHTLRLPGSLEAFESARLFARVTGYVENVTVDVGDRVEANQELVKLTAPELDAEAAHARANVNRRRAELVEARAEAELASLSYERLLRLAERQQGAVSQQAVDEAAAEETLAKAHIAVVEAELDAARESASRARTQAGFRTMTAPFTGRIVARHLHPGALAREGSSSDAVPALELSRTNPLRVVFHAPEPLAPLIHEGMELAVRLAPGAQPRRLTVARYSGSLTESTRSMRVEADLPNADGTYQPGGYASVQLTIERRGGFPKLPSHAVRGQGDERFVLVADSEDILRRRTVTVAADDGRHAVISEGVSMDDRVVIAGSVLAEDGVRAEITDVEPDEDS